MRLTVEQLRGIIREEASRAKPALREGTDASTTDGKRFRGSFSSGPSIPAYAAADEVIFNSDGVITDEAGIAAEEAGLSTGCDADELDHLVSWLDNNVGKTMNPMSRTGRLRGRDSAGNTIVYVFRYFSL
jgi:hypothetical protein